MTGKSEVELKAAVVKDETDPHAHKDYAVFLRREGRLDEAEDQYKKALELKDDFPEAHNNFANLLAQLDRGEEAIGHYQRAIELNEDYAAAHAGLGVLYLMMEDDEKAMPPLVEAWERRKNLPDTGERFLLPLVQILINETPDPSIALDIMIEALEEKGFSEDTRNALLQIAENVASQAGASLQEELNAPGVQFHKIVRGLARAVLGHTELALEDLAEAARIEGHNQPGAAHNLFEILLKYKDRTGQKLPDNWMQVGLEIAELNDPEWPEETLELAVTFKQMADS